MTNTWGYCGTCQRDYRHGDGCACKRVSLDAPEGLPAMTPEELTFLRFGSSKWGAEAAPFPHTPAVPGFSAAKQDAVNAPSHYTDGGIETIDYIAAKLSEDAFAGYLIGNCLKYLSRAGKKNDALEDLKKAQVYLGWLVKVTETGRHK